VVALRVASDVGKPPEPCAWNAGAEEQPASTSARVVSADSGCGSGGMSGERTQTCFCGALCFQRWPRCRPRLRVRRAAPLGLRGSARRREVPDEGVSFCASRLAASHRPRGAALPPAQSSAQHERPETTRSFRVPSANRRPCSSSRSSCAFGQQYFPEVDKQARSRPWDVRPWRRRTPRCLAMTREGASPRQTTSSTSGSVLDYYPARVPDPCGINGALGPGLGWGFTRTFLDGKAHQRSGLTDSSTSTGFTIMPMHLSAVVRF
jgi:hypothetical protein